MPILWNNFLGLGEAIISLLLLVDGVIYWFISKLYGLYIILAQAKIFKEEMYVDISNKVYLIMGVVALFILVYSLLQSIINPDSLKKSGADFAKKFLIGIVMIMLTPSIFNFLYTVQDVVLSDNVIQNIFLGNNTTSNVNGVYVTYFYDKDNPDLTTLELKELLDDPNSNVSLSDFEDDPYGTSTSRKVIRYAVSEDCEYTNDYAEAMANCEKVTIDNGNNTLVKQYGNKMAFIVLEAFIHPTVTGSNPIVDASNAAYASGKSTAGWVGCAIGGIGAIVVGVAGTVAGIWTFGGTTVAGWAGAAAIAGAACGAGALAGNEVYEAVNYKEYKWSDFEYEAIMDGNFDRVTAFVGEGKNNNMGVIGDEYSYMPIVSTISGLVLVYMLLSYCIDLGVRAAKLAFYQMLAPISFLLNTIPGQKDLLSNWIKVVLTTWAEVFVRIFTMLAVVYLISNLDMITFESLGNEALIAKAIIVIGLITFVKQFPKLLGDITGIKSEGMKLGIMDKLNAGTFGFAGGFLGATTGFLGAGIAARAQGGSFWAGGATGMTNGWKAKGNQFGKQKQSMYKSLGGKGKAGILGKQSWGSMLSGKIKDKNESTVRNTANARVAAFENNNSLFSSEKNNVIASDAGYNAYMNSIAGVDQEIGKYNVDEIDASITDNETWMGYYRNTKEYKDFAEQNNYQIYKDSFYDKNLSITENAERYRRMRDNGELQGIVDKKFAASSGENATKFKTHYDKAAAARNDKKAVENLKKQRAELEREASNYLVKNDKNITDATRSAIKDKYKGTKDKEVANYINELKRSDSMADYASSEKSRKEIIKEIEKIMKDKDKS